VSSAPRYRRGMISTIPIAIISILLGWVTHVLHVRSSGKEESGESGGVSSGREEVGSEHSRAGDEPKGQKKFESD
jgi:hypothetical protein